MRPADAPLDVTAEELEALLEGLREARRGRISETESRDSHTGLRDAFVGANPFDYLNQLQRHSAELIRDRRTGCPGTTVSN